MIKSKKSKASRTKVDQDAHNAVVQQTSNTPQIVQDENVLSKDSQKKAKKKNNMNIEINGVPNSNKEIEKNETWAKPNKEDFQNTFQVITQNLTSSDRKLKKKKKKKSKTDNKEFALIEKKDSSIGKDDSQFKLCQIKLYLTLPPCFSNDIAAGVNEFLNCYVFKYLDTFKGIVLLHTDTRYLQNKGLVLYDSPFINFWITTHFLIWRPKVGSKITGTIQIQNVDYIGLILFGTFNAVITANELPSHYKWNDSENQDGEWIDSNTNEPLVNTSDLDFFVKSFSPSQDTLTIMGTLIE